MSDDDSETGAKSEPFLGYVSSEESSEDNRRECDIRLDGDANVGRDVTPGTDETSRGSYRARFKGWFRSAFFYIYLSRILSGWVTQMWTFALGVLMVSITNDSLLLTAIFGFTSGGAVILFGALMGDWMDRNNRLKVARTTVIIRNMSIVIGAVVLCFMIAFPDAMATIWKGWLNVVCKGLVVLFADVAYLATTGNVIAIERDWVVEISGQKTKVLAIAIAKALSSRRVVCRPANRVSTVLPGGGAYTSQCLFGMNAIFHRIDLAMAVLIPLAVGQVMTFASLLTSTIFICGFNMVATVVEYFILLKVYQVVPSLATRKDGTKGNKPRDTTTTSSSNHAGKDSSGSKDHIDSTGERPQKTGSIHRRRILRIFNSFITLYKGWRCYWRQSIRFAGLGLASLYLTVLSFHYLTAGYAYAQGLSESTIGIVAALDAAMGFLGTFGFQFVRSRVGLVKTGVISLGWQVSCLSLCVASVAAPGSPFMDFFHPAAGGAIQNCTVAGQHIGNQSFHSNLTNFTTVTTVVMDSQDDLGTLSNETVGFSNETCLNSTVGERSMAHMGLLMAGIVASRFGLWSADLTITQLFLENVKESERGTVNGVQSSLNMLMDVVRFAIVMVAPRPETFGFLVLMSFCFVSLGMILYCVYVRQGTRLKSPGGEQREDHKTTIL